MSLYQSIMCFVEGYNNLKLVIIAQLRNYLLNLIQSYYAL